jgi:hypothetical protein
VEMVPSCRASAPRFLPKQRTSALTPCNWGPFQPSIGLQVSERRLDVCTIIKRFCLSIYYRSENVQGRYLWSLLSPLRAMFLNHCQITLSAIVFVLICYKVWSSQLDIQVDHVLCHRLPAFAKNHLSQLARG